MNRIPIIAGALASVLMATPATANESFTGEQVHRWCEESEKFCVGLAAGVMIGWAISDWPEPCLPNTLMTFGQLMDVVTKYLRDHPEERHNPGVTVVALAIDNAWPNACEHK
jgi:hypothetical protein